MGEPGFPGSAVNDHPNKKTKELIVSNIGFTSSLYSGFKGVSRTTRPSGIERSKGQSMVSAH